MLWPATRAALRHVMSASIEHSFPASHALQLVTLVKRWEIAPGVLLDGTELDASTLEEPHARISLAQLITLSERARQLTAEPGIGFYLGLQRRTSNYGYLGFATMSASTLRESLELAVRLSATVSTSLTLALDVGTEISQLTFHEHARLGSVHDIACFSLLVGLRQSVLALTGHQPRWLRVDIPFAEPSYFARFRHLLPDARFDQPKLRVSFETRGLDVPLIAPDRAALRLAVEACERELQALGFEHQLAERVRRAAIAPEGFLSLEVVAKKLAMSTRTLKRKLAGQKLTFSELIDEQRHVRAIDLLRASDRTLDDIAEALGYSSAANFTRAFRRWTGRTPAQHRRQTKR